LLQDLHEVRHTESYPPRQSRSKRSVSDFEIERVDGGAQQGVPLLQGG